MSKRSYELFNYQLRPLKQIERKLILEGLNILRIKNIDVSKYRYIGLGSIYYHDFILLHKYLNISYMTCIEKDDIESRMRFNKPYEFIDLWMGDISEKVSEIMMLKEPKLIWFDFDGELTNKILTAISEIVSICEPNTILIITINAHQGSYLKNKQSTGNKYDDLMNDLKEEFGDLIDGISKPDLVPSKISETLCNLIKRKISNSLLHSKNNFTQLFNFVHEDNSPMMTYGGIIGSFVENDFSEYQSILVTESQTQKTIKAPPLTNKEKNYIDANLEKIQTELNEAGHISEFVIKRDLIEAYMEYYRQYPDYRESVV